MRKKLDRKPALDPAEEVCNHCRAEIDEDAIKCPSCGATETDWVCQEGHLNEEASEKCQDLDCLDEESEEESYSEEDEDE